MEEAGYSLLNKSELSIKPGTYNILYLRNSTYNNKEAENSDWKILGSSPAFKLDIVMEDKNNKSEGSSMKSKVSSEERRTQNSLKTKAIDLEDSQNYSKLKTELLENQSLNETFLPLKPKPLNLESYYTNATLSKYRPIKKKEMKENKENNNPNFFNRNF